MSPRRIEALSRAVIEQFEAYVKLNKKIPPEALAAIPQITEAGRLADNIAAHLAVKIADRQQLLEISNVGKRLEKVFALMEAEIGVLQVEKKIRNRVKRQMEKTQREYYLNEQMKAIQRELGEQDDARDELIELEKRIKKTKLSKEAKIKAEGELKKLRNMSPMSAELRRNGAQLSRLAAVDPVGPARFKPIDMVRAEQILEEDHFGLEKVKERILEYFLAVQARTGRWKGSHPVPCRPARGRQDLARPFDCQGDGARIRAPEPGRRARRGGDPRPPADLYRLHARQDRSVDEKGQDDQHLLPAGRDRKDGRRLAR